MTAEVFRTTQVNRQGGEGHMPTKHTSCHPQGTNSATQVISPAGAVQKSFHIKFMIFQQLNVQLKKPNIQRTFYKTLKRITKYNIIPNLTYE